MKIRIKDDSIRVRLTRSEVEHLARAGRLEAVTHFGPGQEFRYAVESAADVNELRAFYNNHCITLQIAVRDAREWPGNAKTGFETIAENGLSGGLRILLEKDFVCLDETVEDQSDNYPNPLAEQFK